VLRTLSKTRDDAELLHRLQWCEKGNCFHFHLCPALSSSTFQAVTRADFIWRAVRKLKDITKRAFFNYNIVHIHLRARRRVFCRRAVTRTTLGLAGGKSIFLMVSMHTHRRKINIFALRRQILRWRKNESQNRRHHHHRRPHFVCVFIRRFCVYLAAQRADFPPCGEIFSFICTALSRQ